MNENHTQPNHALHRMAAPRRSWAMWQSQRAAIGEPNVRLGSMFSRKVEKLQKDGWGFPKLAKENLPARRCRRCKLVIFHYTAETEADGEDQASHAISPPRPER